MDHCLTFFSFFGMYSTRSRVIPNIYVVLSRLARNYKKTGISFCFVYHLNFICPAFWVKLGETSYYPLQASAAQLYLPTECALFLIAKTMTTKAAHEAPRRGEEGRRRTLVLPRDWIARYVIIVAHRVATVNPTVGIVGEGHGPATSAVVPPGPRRSHALVR